MQQSGKLKRKKVVRAGTLGQPVPQSRDATLATQIECGQCGDWYEGVPGHGRRTCPKCKLDNKKQWHRKHQRKIRGVGDGLRKGTGATRTFEEIGQILGCTRDTANKMYKKALLKLRDQAADLIRQSGIESLGGLLNPPDALKVLLERQMEVGKFWGLHHQLVARQRRREARQLVKRIEACQRAINRALHDLK